MHVPTNIFSWLQFLLPVNQSALDTESDNLLQQAIDRASAGRTTLIVAHRLSTIRRAHQVVVLDERHRIVDLGSHDQLSRRCETYRNLLATATAAGFRCDFLNQIG